MSGLVTIRSMFVLHHDNAPSHCAQLVAKFLETNDMLVISHTPYSPDLAPCDFFLFPKLKLALKGLHLEDLDDIKQKLAEYLLTITSEDFRSCFNDWKIRLLKCIHYKGEYFENDKCILERL